MPAGTIIVPVSSTRPLHDFPMFLSFYINTKSQTLLARARSPPRARTRRSSQTGEHSPRKPRRVPRGSKEEPRSDRVLALTPSTGACAGDGAGGRPRLQDEEEEEEEEEGTTYDPEYSLGTPEYPQRVVFGYCSYAAYLLSTYRVAASVSAECRVPALAPAISSSYPRCFFSHPVETARWFEPVFRVT